MILKMGDKSNAKATMLKAGVPCVPGSEGIIKDLKECETLAKSIGYPVMLKASAKFNTYYKYACFISFFNHYTYSKCI